MSNTKWVILWSIAIISILIAMCCVLPDNSNLKNSTPLPSVDMGESAPGPVAEPRPAPLALWKSEMFTVTAYCSCSLCCGSDSDGITASGLSVSEFGGRFIAAPKRFAFGTAFRIPGYANGDPVPVLDRGGKIKGDKLDVYFATHSEAKRFGIQQLLVTYQEN